MHVGQGLDELRQECRNNGDACFRQDMFPSGMFKLRSAIQPIDAQVVSFVAALAIQPK